MATAPPYAPPAPTRRSRAVRLVLVLALHLVAYWLVQRHYAPGPPSPPAEPHHATVPVVLVPASPSRRTTDLPPMPMPTPASPAAAKAAEPAQRQPAPAGVGERPATVAPAARSPMRAEPVAQPATQTDDRTAIAAPDEAASQPMPSPLLDTEASRRAIRASARMPSLRTALAIARSEAALPNAQERLAEQVRSAGKGDCAKGEYAGAGMGLVSVPFLALAVARGDCAQ